MVVATVTGGNGSECYSKNEGAVFEEGTNLSNNQKEIRTKR